MSESAHESKLCPKMLALIEALAVAEVREYFDSLEESTPVSPEPRPGVKPLSPGQ